MKFFQTSPVRPVVLLPSRRVRERYNVCGRTLKRWCEKPELGFPPAITINGRCYFDESALTAWERDRASMRCGCGETGSAESHTTLNGIDTSLRLPRGRASRKQEG